MRYEIIDKSEEREQVYAVVYLDDGTSFGQYLDPGTTEQMDSAIREAVKRVGGESARPSLEAIQMGIERQIEVALPLTTG